MKHTHRHFVERVVGREWGGDFFVDFARSDTKLSRPDQGKGTINRISTNLWI
jgi:hypothetical protein